MRYSSSSKADITKFKIDAINYSSDFTKADVLLTVTQIWKMKAEGFMQDTEVPAPMSTAWKIENGKWVFYQPPPAPNAWVTPMGPSAGFHKPDGTTTIPEKLDDATITSEAARILHQTSIDKRQVTLATDKPSSAKVVFHNGAQGSVSVSVVGFSFPGLSAKLDKQDLNAGQDAVLEISYDPSGKQNFPASFEINLDVAPFDQLYPVDVIFAPAK